MTEKRIANVVEELKQIISTDYSDYAGFRLQASEEEGFNNCFIVNNESLFSSNFSTPIDNSNDALKIIQNITGQSDEEILEELDANGSYYNLNRPLYLHYLKLTKKCD